ncbi:MAG: hypothetical protein OMM_13155 [Candidatus Magnetoglobus multicellularis str. Araruama]|uniref:Transposase (putative) YhgA-like domain-containing protein n=1 Tax=Candidatus Magnetoglobus multicellularis str. Araruama TaxID=890399 RepID=A0A1V1NU98_9BACT|nr:MAG: hypothetical protein OMM_13155 [Candidatus Magnetoglobus multicellularis str. Araruama]
MLHIEVQGQPQDIFPDRMFTYATRLRDRYQLMVVSLAILADDDPNWRPSTFTEELWGCKKNFEFPMIKLLDYHDKWEELETSDNPFAVVVIAHLNMLETKNNHEQRLNRKIELTQKLYGMGYSEEKVFALFRFIDWLMVLPDDLTKTFNETISHDHEVLKMKYLTTIEQFALKEARLEAERRGEKRGEKLGEKRGEDRGKLIGQIAMLDMMRQNNTIPHQQYEQMIAPLYIQLQALTDDPKSSRKRYK